MKKLRVLAIFALLLLLSSPLGAEKLQAPEDNSWLSLDGVVIDRDSKGFELDYGYGTVWVTMENWKWDQSIPPLTSGSRIRVTGKAGSAEGGATRLIAESVFLKDLNTYLHAREGEEVFQPAFDQDRVFQLQGRITSTQESTFTMRVGGKKVIVDISAMPYNPLDNKGYQQLKTGETVQVTGRLTSELFTEGGIEAQTVTTLLRGR